MTRNTKIVATIGPSVQSKDAIRALIQAGMNVARLNFSHGEHADHARAHKTIRQVAKELGQPIAIMQDLQGPKIRTGEQKTETLTLAPGQSLTLTTQPIIGDEKTISVDFPDLPRAVQPGGRILLDDGAMELEVESVSGDEVHTTVLIGGELKENKGVNLLGARLKLSGFTEKDQADLKFGLELGVDLVAISFVCDTEDVTCVRQAIADLDPNANIPLIAKLERPQALENLENIIHEADGVMVARGDLGVEMPPETVPIAQKQIIETANLHGKLVITATQMLDSMITNRRPTRAEASDVANAILDGTDAVMLSGETAIGKYPTETVEMMAAIIRETETHRERWGHWRGGFTHPDRDDAQSLTIAARELAHDRDVAAIAVFTQSGRTARLMSKVSPQVPILAFTPIPEIYRRMALYWGVIPHLIPPAHTFEEMIAAVETAMLAATPIHPGQQVVIVAGFPVTEMRPPNFALLHTIKQR